MWYNIKYNFIKCMLNLLYIYFVYNNYIKCVYIYILFLYIYMNG